MNDILERLYNAKQKQIDSGFAERHPDVFENLLNKIKTVAQGGKYQVKDITVEAIASVGGLFPIVQCQWDLDYHGDSQMTGRHIDKKRKLYDKFITDMWAGKVPMINTFKTNHMR